MAGNRPELKHLLHGRWKNKPENCLKQDSFLHVRRLVTKNKIQLSQYGICCWLFLIFFFSFITELDDLVRCFQCGVGLRNWDPEDEPWVEHARWMPLCPFVVANNSMEFIERVQEAVRQNEVCYNKLTKCS